MKILQKRREFADKGLLFIFKNIKELTRVTILNSNYSTKNGIKVGSTIEDVKKYFGEPKKITSDSYNDKEYHYEGITFMYKKSKVSSISIGLPYWNSGKP